MNRSDFTPEQLDVLDRLSRGEHVGDSDRDNDKVRQKLRRKGLIVFEARGTHRWFLTPAGVEARKLRRTILAIGNHDR